MIKIPSWILQLTKRLSGRSEKYGWVVFISLFSAIYSTDSQSAPDLSTYDLIFSEEFSELQLDDSKWNSAYLWGPYLPINNEEQFYVDSLGLHQLSGYTPFELTGESLIIRADPVSSVLQVPDRPEQSDPIWDDYIEYRYNGVNTETGERGFDSDDVGYLSGLITSYDSFRFTHGYAEARIKLPKGQGLWPAFWSLTSFYVEDVPEIDIVEYLGGDPSTAYHTYHYFEPKNDWAQISTPSFQSLNVDWTSEFHTFGVLWGPKEIVWFVDGVEAHRISDSNYTIPNQAMYLLANLAVGGNWPGPADSTTPFPAEFEIDYIRAYQKKTPDIITPKILESDYVLMFQDEFNGATLDFEKWNTSHLWGPFWQINNEMQFYPDIGNLHDNYAQNPFSVNDGILTITANTVADIDLPVMPSADSSIFLENREWRNNKAYRNPQFTNPPFSNQGHDPTKASQPFLPQYTSGIITTYDSFKFVNGYAEIRAKLPAGDGLWPAFWLLNGYYVDQQPEIDILEMRGET